MISANLEGKRVLITGASSGLGEHFASVLAMSGAHIILAARREEKLVNVASNLRKSGGSIETIKLDVADMAQVSRLTRKIGKVDVLVNNAGMSSSEGSLQISEDEWRRTFEVNLNGTWFMIKGFADQWISSGSGGSIINIASITGLGVSAGSAAYATSKAAIIHLTKNLAHDYSRYGIRVNAIAPGYFETDLNRKFLKSEFARKMQKRIPLRRWGKFEELNGPLLLLASDASSYITGATIVVDGGHTCATQ